jgi:uncharacterized protein DUF4350
MKDWLVSAGLALAALALFWLLMFPKPAGPHEANARPLSTEAGAAGVLALTRWLKAERVPVVAWRRRFDGLSGAAIPAGNVLITFMPHAMPVRRAELAALDAWLRAGNTLVVMAALADTPRWSAANYPFGFRDQLQRITRLKFDVADAPSSDSERARAAVDAALAPPSISIEPVATAAGPHPLFAGVAALESRSDLPASRWTATPMDLSPVLELARRADTREAAVWIKAFGAGTMIVSAFASPLSNEALGAAGNARWLANVIGFSLQPGGSVYLDDAHQGATDLYDPNAFFGDPRLHSTLWWIVLVWFLFVVGARALVPAAAGKPPVDDAAMLRVTGEFYATAVTPQAAGERLIEHFFNAIRRRLGFDEDGAPLWDWLAGHARISPTEVAELRALHATLRDGRAVNLERLQTLLSSISGQLA